MSVEAAVSIGGWLIDGYANSVPLHFVWNVKPMQSFYFIFTFNQEQQELPLHIVRASNQCILSENAIFWLNPKSMPSFCFIQSLSFIHLTTLPTLLPLHFVWTSNQMQSFIQIYFLGSHCLTQDSNILISRKSNCLYILFERQPNSSFVLHICLLQSPCITFWQTRSGCTLSEPLTNAIF